MNPARIPGLQLEAVREEQERVTDSIESRALGPWLTAAEAAAYLRLPTRSA